MSARRWSRAMQAARLGAATAAAALVISAAGAGHAGAQRFDPGFGEGGVSVLAKAGGNVKATDLRSDGSVMAVGRLDGRSMIARLSPEGPLDQAFGEGGLAPRAQFAFGGCSKMPCESAFNSVWAEEDGAVVVGGWDGRGSGLAELPENGIWDPDQSNFGNFGYYSGYTGPHFADVTRYPGGGFTAVGYGGDRTKASTGATAFHFDPNGDTTFRWGNQPSGFDQDSNLYELQWPQARSRGVEARFTGVDAPTEGWMYASGWIRTRKGAPKRMFVHGITKKGESARRFGATRPGLSIFGPGTEGVAVAASADRTAYVVGTKRRGADRIIVAKLDLRGRLVRSFGRDGILTVPVKGAVARSIAIDGGTVYVGGSRTAGARERAVIAAYRAGGRPVRSFGAKGVLVTGKLGTANSIEVVEGAGGALLVGGSAPRGGRQVPAVARLIG